jgi:catechol 2,3-dioxygenase-like lactoylglutathione lyase family enzyme
VRVGVRFPPVFDHVGIWVSDRAASEPFYVTVLGALGRELVHSLDEFAEWEDFALGASPDRPVTTGLHIAFFAPTRDHVHAFWQAGVDAGHPSDGEPGPRPQYADDYYGGFLLDPDGNSVEAVHRGDARAPGAIDHLWIRVADVNAARRFYDAIAPHAGFARGDGVPGTVQFRGARGTFSVLSDDRPPTRNLHMAFPGDRAAVHAFHETATAAGYRDNGAPGPRPQYHPGYYAAFVLDPDGNNVEVVDHGDG